jgi:putative radical SAM enzyme (TIGR03279 family)
MTYFTEIDWTSQPGGQIVNILPDSLASELELRVGDHLLAINDQKVMDIIDVRFYAAEENLELLIRRADEYIIFEAVREYNQTLGLEFQHPTFDIDIRRCNNLCEFCFVLQMAPRFRRTLYIKDDDYRYSFLFGHYVTLTNLDEHDWWKIETMGLSPLYVSVHSTDLDTRRQFLRNSDAPDIIPQLGRLASAGIEVHTQIVIVPELNDGQLLEQSINDLAAMWPAVRSISVVPVGLTRHHKYRMRTHTKEEAGAILDKVESFQQRLRKRFGVGFV